MSARRTTLLRCTGMLMAVLTIVLLLAANALADTVTLVEGQDKYFRYNPPVKINILAKCAEPCTFKYRTTIKASNAIDTGVEMQGETSLKAGGKKRYQFSNVIWIRYIVEKGAVTLEY